MADNNENIPVPASEDETVKEIKNYFMFTLMSKSENIIESKLDREETLEKATAELEMFFGPGGYEIIEFRPATDEEMKTAGIEDTPVEVSNTVH